MLPFCALLVGAGCDQLPPPLDQLPLRDALRADPDVVATLPDDARQRLAARLSQARAGETADEPIGHGDGDGDTTPGLLIARVDHARELRGQDALIISVVTAGGVHPVSGVTDAATATPLPSLGADSTSAATSALEAQGLAAGGGAAVRALLAASGARRVQRVVGWPAGAIAIGDTVYVNAAWLVALAPTTVDGGATRDGDTAGATPAAAGTVAAAPGGARATPSFQNDDVPGTPTAPDAGAVDAGRPVYSPPPTSTPPPTPTPTPTYPPPDLPPDDGATCGGGCDASGSSGDDCSSSSDSGDDCSSSSDGGDDACQGGGDDAAACESSDDEGGCQVARGRRRAGNGTLLSLVAPLAFLLPRRRR